jgi:hypothetical protein
LAGIGAQVIDAADFEMTFFAMCTPLDNAVDNAAPAVAQSGGPT